MSARITISCVLCVMGDVHCNSVPLSFSVLQEKVVRFVEPPADTTSGATPSKKHWWGRHKHKNTGDKGELEETGEEKIPEVCIVCGFMRNYVLYVCVHISSRYKSCGSILISVVKETGCLVKRFLPLFLSLPSSPLSPPPGEVL